MPFTESYTTPQALKRHSWCKDSTDFTRTSGNGRLGKQDENGGGGDRNDDGDSDEDDDDFKDSNDDDGDSNDDDLSNDNASLASGDERIINVKPSHSASAPGSPGSHVNTHDIRPGAVRTRRQRCIQAASQSTGTNADTLTTAAATTATVCTTSNVCVDTLWKEIMQTPLGQRFPRLTTCREHDTTTASHSGPSDPDSGSGSGAQSEMITRADDPSDPDANEYIIIDRTYTFAGERKRERKRVHRESAEARVYLATRSAGPPGPSRDPTPDPPLVSRSGDEPPVIRRPLARPSRFEPNTLGIVRSLPLDVQSRWAPHGLPRRPIAALHSSLTAKNLPVHLPTVRGKTSSKFHRLHRRAAASLTTSAINPAIVTFPAASTTTMGGHDISISLASMPTAGTSSAPTLNTVDKSRFDWANFVDREGITEELNQYNKARENYSAREAFLASVEHRRYASLHKSRLSLQR